MPVFVSKLRCPSVSPVTSQSMPAPYAITKSCWIMHKAPYSLCVWCLGMTDGCHTSKTINLLLTGLDFLCLIPYMTQTETWFMDNLSNNALKSWHLHSTYSFFYYHEIYRHKKNIYITQFTFNWLSNGISN